MQKGSLLQLAHEPDNEFDANAVAVHHLPSNKKIGHISKELAPKYCQLLQAGRIIDASVKSVTKVGGYFDIVISIRYISESEISATRNLSRFSRTIDQVGNVSGVYAIKNVQNGQQYIGSSVRVRERLKSHLSALIFKIHPNVLISADFKSIGADAFEAQLLERIAGEDSLLAAEAKWISDLTSKGVTLYNRTLDGRGVLPGSKPYSDWLNPNSKRAVGKKPYLVEFKEFGRVSLADLKRIRSALARYLEKLKECDTVNRAIREENEQISRRNARVQSALEQYRQSQLKPLEQQISQIGAQLEEHKVGTIAGLWTSSLDFKPSRFGKSWQAIKVKDTPLARGLIERHSELVSAYQRAEERLPPSHLEQLKPLRPAPKDKSNITISGKKHYLDLQKLDLLDLDRLIKELSAGQK